MISVTHKGNECYFVDATLIKEDPQIYTVMFKDKLQKWPKANVEMVGTGRFAVKIEFYDIMNDQNLFKRTAMVKATFRRNKQKIPKPRMPRLGKN